MGQLTKNGTYVNVRVYTMNYCSVLYVKCVVKLRLHPLSDPVEPL